MTYIVAPLLLLLERAILGNGIGFGMEHIGFGEIVFIFTYILKPDGVPLYPSEIIILSFTMSAPT